MRHAKCDKAARARRLLRQFAALRYVKIRVPSHTEHAPNAMVQTSARAKCLAQSAVDEQLQLHLDLGGSISAIEYRVECQAPSSNVPSDWSPPQQVSVVCRFPETVAPMRLTVQPGILLGLHLHIQRGQGNAGLEVTLFGCSNTSYAQNLSAHIVTVHRT